MVLVMVIVMVMVMAMAMDRKNQRRCRIWNPSSKLFRRQKVGMIERTLSRIIGLSINFIPSSLRQHSVIPSSLRPFILSSLHPFIPSSLHPFIPYRLGKLWLFLCWNFSLPQPFLYILYVSFRVSQLHWEISWSTRFSPNRPNVDIFDQGFQQFAISYFQYHLN